MLVVEGRGGVSWLTRTGLDLRGVTNIYQMANTPDPRDFYKVSRVVLMPSLWQEALGRVAAEAMMNGIPVLGSNRGGLPEVLAEAGFIMNVPAKYTPESREVPTVAEVLPWIEKIIRLYDDPAFYEAESRRALGAAQAWRPERLLPRWEAFFTELPRR